MYHMAYVDSFVNPVQPPTGAYCAASVRQYGSLRCASDAKFFNPRQAVADRHLFPPQVPEGLRGGRVRCIVALRSACPWCGEVVCET